MHLADLCADPGERNDLSDQYPEVKDQLLRDLRSWSEELEAQ